ncbi:CLUMA_CG013340, isoform A [Clunio marinus]|uniref:CLUMA_CG013340, isoform A n=1 Tax=Clunio marinus TaxID=568069 RepID=A0A1J1IIJ5_9DIPT|nr:CLUMA_CG013340, isoform A [Clunio marinus]
MLVLAALIFIFGLVLYYHIKMPYKFPPGPSFNIPIIGHSHLVRKLSKKYGGQHKAFESLLEKYGGPILGLKLGRELVIVAFTYDIVKEIHTREEFDGRPDNFFLRLRTMGTRLGITCTDGKLWNEQRSFVVRQLRNVGYGKSKMEDQIQSELKELTQLIEDFDGKPVWPMKELLPPSVINILWVFTTGKRIHRNDERLLNFLNLLQKRSKAFDMSGGILTSMPYLRFFAPEKTGYNLIKGLNAEFYKFFMEIIEEHLATYSEEKSNDDLIYAYIKEMKVQKENPDTSFTLLQLVMIILDIFIAGSQTTSTTIDLALMVTLMRPDLHEKCVKEINEVLGRNETPSYALRSQMPFIEAMILEVQRFFHVTPLTGPRRVLKTCELGGYRIPKDSTVLISLRSVHMDPEFWKDPEVFRPERFLDQNMIVKNLDRLIPFGAGRRKCLGDQLAKACIFTFYVGILQKFNLKSVENEFPSLDLLPGIILSPKPYKVIFEKKF